MMATSLTTLTDALNGLGGSAREYGDDWDRTSQALQYISLGLQGIIYPFSQARKEAENWNIAGRGIIKVFDDMKTSISAWRDETQDKLRGWFENLESHAKQLPGKIRQAFEQGLENFQNIGKAIVEGIRAGIEAAWDAFVAWVLGKIGGIIDAILASIGASEKARAAMPIGSALALGIHAGFDRAWGGAARSMTADVAGLVGARAGTPSFAGSLRPALAAAPSGVALGGDTYYVSIQDRLAAAMFLSAVKDRQTARLNGGMR
jgi:hypothetical protein